MTEDTLHTRGALVSAVLAGSWRCTSVHPLGISETHLDEVSPLLYGSGAAALGWWRVRDSELKSTASAAVLQQAYWLQALQSAIHEEKIKKVFRLVRESSIEAVLIKGWVAANLYPDRALRPYGDIDLVVKPADYNKAKAIMEGAEAKDCWVDLHKNISELADRSLDDLFQRARTLSLGDEAVRVVSVEDHLALLSVHLLKHGAWRPLWLCDVAAAIESLPSDFDWDTCLGHNPKRAAWIACAIRLAQRLLQAESPDLPPAIRNLKLPEWLVHNVLQQWESPFAVNQPPMRHPLPMSNQFRHPHGVWKAVRDRWPNPIIATISVNGKLNRTPRLPYQLANCVSRLAQFLAHLPHELRN